MIFLLNNLTFEYSFSITLNPFLGVHLVSNHFLKAEKVCQLWRNSIIWPNYFNMEVSRILKYTDARL